MSLNINYCRLCLQKTEESAKTLSNGSKIFKQVTALLPDMDTSLVIHLRLCIECFKNVQYSNLMIETVTKNEQKLLLDLHNTQLYEKITCRLCLNNEKVEVAVCLFKNSNEEARHVIEIAIIDLNFDIFRKPVLCNNCWQAVKSIYLFKKKCFATEKILKYYCATNKVNFLDRNELEMVSSSKEELQQFSKNLDEDNVLFDRIARCIGNSSLTQNILNPQDMYLNNFIENKGSDLEEVSYIANTLNVQSELVIVKDEIKIKEEKICEFEASDENVVPEILNKTEHVENEQFLMNHSSEHKTHLSLKCEECPYETGEEVHLKSHQSMEKILKCSECYYITVCSNSLKNHMETHKTISKTFKCKKCDYVTRRPNTLQTHMLIHQENSNFRCHNCSYQTKRKSNLVVHMVTHQDNYNFPCDKCDYQAKRKTTLVKHMLIHQEIYNFPCDKCSYRAKTKSNLVAHMLVHQENYNFPCDKCSYHAKSKYNLANHMLIHQDNYNFQCPKCNYQAKRKANLINHMLVHQENYNFPCDKCSYRAKTRSNLVRHMVIHQDNYNFQCDKCGYQATSDSKLVSHMLIHQDNYNFSCYKCNYQAKRKTDLASHMLIHQESYNFKCEECSYRAKRKSQLIRHMLKHQNEKKDGLDISQAVL